MSERFKPKITTSPADVPPKVVEPANDNEEAEIVLTVKREQPLHRGGVRVADTLMSESEIEARRRIHELAEESLRSENEAEAKKAARREKATEKKKVQDQNRLEGIKEDRDSERLLGGSLERILYEEKTAKENKLKFSEVMQRAKELFPSKATPKERTPIYMKELNPAEKDPIFNEPTQKTKADTIKSARTPEEVTAVRKERLKDERWAYKNLEKRYLDAHAEYLKKNHVTARLAKGVFETEDVKELKELKGEYYTARQSFLKQFEDQKRAELEERQERVYAELRTARELAKAENREQPTNEELAALREKLEKKYHIPERTQRFKADMALERLRSTKYFLVEKNKARFEQFSFRQKLGFGKLANWTKKKGEQVGESVGKFIDEKAPWIRKMQPSPEQAEKINKAIEATLKWARPVAIAALVVSGTTAAMTGAIPTTVLLTALLATKSISAAAAGSYGFGKGYRKFLGLPAHEKAKETIDTYGKKESWNAKGLEKADKEYVRQASRASEETLNAKTNAVSTAATLLLSFGFGAFIPLSAMEGAVSSVEKFTPVRALEHAFNKLIHLNSPADAPASVAHGASASYVPKASLPKVIQESVSEAHIPAFDGINIHVSDKELSKGAGALIQQLQRSLSTVPGLANAHIPQELLHGNPSALAEKLGFPHGNAEGVMKPGDWLQLTKDNQLIFHRGGESILVLQEVIQRGIEAHEGVIDNATDLHEFFAKNAEHLTKVAHATHTHYEGKGHPADVGHEVTEPIPQTDVVPQPEAPTPAPAPEVQHPAPEQAPQAAPTPAPAPEVAPTADTLTSIIHNSHGLEINVDQSNLYADAHDNLVSFGGSLEDRMDAAVKYVQGHHDAVVFLDSSSQDATGHLAHHLTRVTWEESLNQVQAPNEAMDPTLQGLSLPTSDDLVRRIPLTS